MAETRQVANVCSVVLYEYLSATQQVLSFFKAVLHHNLIEHVESAGLIVQSKEIKVAVFNQTNTKAIIKEALRTKNIQGRVTDEKLVMSMTNMNVCSASKKQQSTSDYPSDLDQIKAIGVPISTRYRWRSESRKKRKLLLEGKYELWVSVKKRKNYSKVTPELIEHLHEWIGNHPQVVNSPISNDTLVVSGHKRPGKKIRVSKLLLKI